MSFVSDLSNVSATEEKPFASCSSYDGLYKSLDGKSMDSPEKPDIFSKRMRDGLCRPSTTIRTCGRGSHRSRTHTRFTSRKNAAHGTLCRCAEMRFATLGMGEALRTAFRLLQFVAGVFDGTIEAGVVAERGATKHQRRIIEHIETGINIFAQRS